MRRRLVSSLKFLLMALGVVTSTVFIFKLVRPYTKPTSNLPQAMFLQDSMMGKLPVEPPDSREMVLIDWHDYGKIQADLKKTGVGERGKPAHLSPADDELKEKLYSVNGFNGALSDKISLHRSLPDIRHAGCKAMKYNAYLPTVSVVVPFHNEHWSTLLRTATSVLDRSPEHLIKEIILVDDYSNKAFLKAPLDEYVKVNMTKVKVIHLPERKGLIVARLAGAKAATGDVLIFLDSHVEANVNWLPPLLHPISQDYRTCVCPFIDVIAFDTFEYRAQDEGARGAFDWEFFYKRLPVLPEDEVRMPEPFPSPVMAGGLFAISRKFFWELGGYDEELQIWGGEQYELSFKIWQCGGKMLDAPCSRVGHIYRKFAPFPNAGKGDFVGRNYRRVAEVWMDGYKEFLYNRRPHYRDIDPGDLTKQREIRERLKCKPFKWFMKEVAFDLPKKYPPYEPEPFASGFIRSLVDETLCVDSMNRKSHERFDVSKCGQGGEQNFQLSWHKDIRCKSRSMCWDVSSSEDKAPILLYSCHLQGGNQFWRYDQKEKWLVHGGNPRCLDIDVSTKQLFVRRCDPNAKTQKWKLENINYDRLKKFDEEPSLDYEVD